MRIPFNSTRLGATLLLAALASCEPTVVVERDETATIPAGSTWAWSLPDGDGLAPEQGDIAPTEPVAQAIVTSIEDALAARGYRRTALDSATFVVHFHLGRREVVDTIPITNDSPRTVTDRDPQNWGRYGSPEAMGARTTTWQEGMLIVDALTVADGKLAWRGIVVGEIRPDVENEPTAAIKAAVGRLFSRFP
jgi:hypothetical protein